jgi:hypothetical protein
LTIPRLGKRVGIPYVCPTRFTAQFDFVGSRADDLKSKVPGDIASEIGVSSREKVPIKVVEIYAFI